MKTLFRLALLLCSVGLIFQALACGTATQTNPSTSSVIQEPAQNPPPSESLAKACEFNHHITDIASLKSVSPLGMVGAGDTEIVGRSYMFVKQDWAGRAIPIYAPADVTLFAASHYVPQGAPVGYAPDWALWFTLDCNPQQSLQLFHIKQVSPRIEAVVPAGLSSSSALMATTQKVSFKAGEVMAFYVKGINDTAWDFIVYDERVTNVFANPARYLAQHSNVLNVVCPFDEFREDLKTQYYALLAAPGSDPAPGLTCGSVSRDVPGSIAGQWFLSEDASAGFGSLRQEGFYGNPFPIVLRPDGIIDFGHVGPVRDVRIDSSNPSFQDPSLLTTEHCYQIYEASMAQGYLYFRVLSESGMQLSYSDVGLCPAVFPTSNFKNYYR